MEWTRNEADSAYILYVFFKIERTLLIKNKWKFVLYIFICRYKHAKTELRNLQEKADIFIERLEKLKKNSP